jgi:hypothetical protein
VEHTSEGWVVDTGSERFRVAEPVARTPAGSASAMGADTAAVLARLGIGAA